jgi:hypothetical protein
MKNIKYNLFLDDIRYPYLDPIKFDDLDDHILSFASAYEYSKFEPFKNEEWEIVRNYDEFVKIIEKKGVPKIVAFDHDLGIEHYPKGDVQAKNTKIINYDDFDEKTGYDCAKWLCNYCQDNNIKFPEYYVHSWNKIGSDNIINYIENYKKYVENE